MNKTRKNSKKGMALVMALVFAVVLLQMAIAFSSMTQTSKPQTVQIDERIKLDYLAHGLTELALLKFQLYPGDYYACWEAHELGTDNYLNRFTINAPEFTIANFTDSKSSFNDQAIGIQLASMAIYTDNRWKTEALFIQAGAEYTDQFGREISKDAVRIVSLQRVLKK
ncbi:MAG: hypothetical protein PWR01_1939 [Clostridiales bacterium]|jgi:hypothetical protein|nr:hypothetical protein [Clostridiales bacterium]MDN5280866.1 hypothetical protein [Candidatus Ozemobacter sp.]